MLHLVMFFLLLFQGNVQAQESHNTDTLICPLDNGTIQKWILPHPYSLIEPKKGATIVADKDLQVKSIFNGVVLKIDTLSADNRIILIRNSSYIASFSGLKDVYVKEAEKVKKAQRIGNVKPAIDQESTLYLEIWKESEKINPLDFIHCQ